jgi:hypothetical protein
MQRQRPPRPNYAHPRRATHSQNQAQHLPQRSDLQRAKAGKSNRMAAVQTQAHVPYAAHPPLHRLPGTQRVSAALRTVQRRVARGRERHERALYCEYEEPRRAVEVHFRPREGALQGRVIRAEPAAAGDGVGGNVPDVCVDVYKGG